jgi:hypothetical protein
MKNGLKQRTVKEQRMSTVQVQSQVSLDELLNGVGQLSLPELERFVTQAIALLAERKSPSLSKDEAELLIRVNQGLPLDIQKRHDELVAKRKAEALTPDEYQELLNLIDEIEKADAERAKHLVELARLRGTSLAAVMEDLGIRAPTCV